MLSLKKCREILGPTCRLNDSEIEQLRDQLYALADITVSTLPSVGKSSHFLNEPTSAKIVDFKTMFVVLSETERQEAFERVSIMEFEGGLSRTDAEDTVFRQFLNRKNN